MIKVIKTEEQYEAALEMVEKLMDLSPEQGSEDCDKLELLVLLIQVYEKEHYPMELPDPIDAIEFRMEQQGLAPKDLIRYLGSRSKVSEVLNRRRPLSLNMIRALHKGLGIQAEVLLQDTGKGIRYKIPDGERPVMSDKIAYPTPKYSGS